MTIGQLLFYGGAALLGLTVLLAIIFIVKKPKYTPESAASAGTDPGRTQNLRNGYPTDRMTGSGAPVQPAATETIRQSQETVLLPETLTELLPDTKRSPETEVMGPQQTGTRTKE